MILNEKYNLKEKFILQEAELTTNNSAIEKLYTAYFNASLSNTAKMQTFIDNSNIDTDKLFSATDYEAFKNNANGSKLDNWNNILKTIDTLKFPIKGNTKNTASDDTNKTNQQTTEEIVLYKNKQAAVDDFWDHALIQLIRCIYNGETLPDNINIKLRSIGPAFIISLIQDGFKSDNNIYVKLLMNCKAGKVSLTDALNILEAAVAAEANDLITESDIVGNNNDNLLRTDYLNRLHGLNASIIVEYLKLQHNFKYYFSGKTFKTIFFTNDKLNSLDAIRKELKTINQATDLQSDTEIDNFILKFKNDKKLCAAGIVYLATQYQGLIKNARVLIDGALQFKPDVNTFLDVGKLFNNIEIKKESVCNKLAKRLAAIIGITVKN